MTNEIWSWDETGGEWNLVGADWEEHDELNEGNGWDETSRTEHTRTYRSERGHLGVSVEAEGPKDAHATALAENPEYAAFHAN